MFLFINIFIDQLCLGTPPLLFTSLPFSLTSKCWWVLKNLSMRLSFSAGVGVAALASCFHISFCCVSFLWINISCLTSLPSYMLTAAVCQTVLQHLKLRWAQIGLISLSLVLLSFWFPWKAPSFFWCLKCKTNNFESRFPLPPFRSAQLSAPWCFLSVSITSCTDALVSLFTAYASPALGPLVSLPLWACHSTAAGGAAVT